MTDQPERETMSAPFSQELATACGNVENAFIEGLLGMVSDLLDCLHGMSHEFVKQNPDDEKCKEFSGILCNNLNIFDTGLSTLCEMRNDGIRRIFKEDEGRRN